MKYYWIASTIEIKTAVLPCREINTNNYLILADFKSFYWTSLLILRHFIDHCTIFLGHQNPGPDYYCFSRIGGWVVAQTWGLYNLWENTCDFCLQKCDVMSLNLLLCLCLLQPAATSNSGPRESVGAVAAIVRELQLYTGKNGIENPRIFTMADLSGNKYFSNIRRNCTAGTWQELFRKKIQQECIFLRKLTPQLRNICRM